MIHEFELRYLRQLCRCSDALPFGVEIEFGVGLARPGDHRASMSLADRR